MKHYVCDKVVIITGGSSGYGLAAAQMLLEMGSSVVITGRSKERLAEAIAELNSDRVTSVQADATQTPDWMKLVDVTLQRFGRIDVLINNHGAALKIAPTHEMSDEDIHAVMDANIISVIKGCREIVLIMKKQGFGRIVNVSSGCALRGWADWGIYSAAKAAMVGFTRCLHREMCEWGGIASNFIPGSAKTNFCKAAGINDEYLQEYPEPEDIARMIVNTIDLPDNTAVEEIRVWGTKQIHDVLNPY